MLRRRMLMKRLPSEYQEVEWISTEVRGRLIDTEYIPTLDKTRIQVEAIKEQGLSVFGSGTNTFVITGTKNVGDFAYYNGVTSTKYSTQQDIFHTWELDKNLFKIDGETKYTFASVSATATYSISLFARKVGDNSYNDAGLHKIKLCKIWEDDELVRNMIACYRISDGRIGMYDLCGSICSLTNSPLYIDVRGGEFIKGTDVN